MTAQQNVANLNGALIGSPEDQSIAISPEEILKLTLELLDEESAEEIVSIDLAGKSDVADALVIASGRSQRHVSALAEKLARALKDAGHGNVSMEGQPACDWVLVDAKDVVIHLFRPEVRSFYNLERIWSEKPATDSKTPDAN